MEDLADAVEAADGRNGFRRVDDRRVDALARPEQLSQSDLESGELRIGLPAALIILILVFGALVAAGLPLLLAIVSIIVALGLTGLVAQGFTLSVFVINMLTAMGLALGIDYCLFVVSRVREERARGADHRGAISRRRHGEYPCSSSGSALCWLLGLLIVPSTIMRPRRRGHPRRGGDRGRRSDPAAGAPGAAGRSDQRPPRADRGPVGRARRRRRGRLLGARGPRRDRPAGARARSGRGALLAAAVPLFSMNIGAASEDTLPDRLQSKQGLLALQRSFPAASAQPAEVVIDAPPTSPQVQAAVGRLRQELARDGRFGDVQVARYPTGT